MTSQKALKTTCSFPPDQAEWIDGELARRGWKEKNKRSQVVQECVALAMQGAEIGRNALAADVLVKLAGPLLGELDARKLGAALADTDQPELLQTLLRDLLARVQPRQAAETPALYPLPRKPAGQILPARRPPGKTGS